ncbi:MAG TPA: hypothetical protein VNW68_07045, partial [Candidatus Limnocylindria bacterium]|nr:hypothetical protein [Candidatus Limnocylindria bacterium]
GQALELLYPERRAELAAVLARHFEQAGEAEQAIRYLTEAAGFAYARNAIVESYELYSRAAALLPSPDPTDAEPLRRQRIEIDLGRLKAGLPFLGEEQSFALLEPLVLEADRLGDPKLAADVHMHGLFLRQYRGERPATSPELRRTLDRVAEIGRQLGDPSIAGLASSLIGLFKVFTGDLLEGVERLREAAPLLEQRRAFVGSSFALVALAIGLARLGDFDEAAAAARRASALAENGDLIARLDALIGESQVRSVRGDLAGAEPIALECANLSQETGATACLVASSFVLGDVLMRQGRYGDAKIAFERGGAVAEVTEQKIFRPSIAAYLRATAANLGDFGPKARSFDEALSEARSVGDRWGEANVLWKRAETELRQADGKRDQALDDLAAAAAAFESMSARPFHARVLRDWGSALRQHGAADLGDQRLAQALAIFEGLGLAAEAAEVRAELAVSGGAS